ncbi:winged helix-turn-helix domain-containing protein, partial [Escherichia coli]|uniref:winged helix-turn-helix domain-containing protein n=1 Tax=Escherichia coli TaxID=562 RepID=UPI0023816294
VISLKTSVGQFASAMRPIFTLIDTRHWYVIANFRETDLKNIRSGTLSRRELSINDEVIKLTAFEYTIMETLIRNNGKVVSKDSLMLQLYPDAELRESHTIDVLMGRLRKKIQAQYPQEVITTVRKTAP